MIAPTVVRRSSVGDSASQELEAPTGPSTARSPRSRGRHQGLADRLRPSLKTKANDHGLLYGIFGYAADQGYLSVDPCARTAPKRSRIRQSQVDLRFRSESDRAGRSSVVVEETDLDAAAAHATQVGIVHDGPQSGHGARILQLTDLDGDRVVLTGT